MDRRELSEGLEIVAEMLAAAGEPFAGADRELLLSYASDQEGAPGGVHDRLDALFAAAQRGFLHCAATGRRLEVPAHLGEGFADSIEDTYPGAGAAYLKLATSYWSLKMLEARIGERYSGVLLQQLLLDVVSRVERTFFAEPSAKRSAEQLAAAQRELLTRSGAPIDAEELLHANPLLVGNPLG